MNRVLLVSFVAASVLAAGCAEAPAAPASSSSSIAPAPEATTEADLGSISGRAVDDESRPVPRVRVNLVETNMDATTDSEGRFTFNGLAPGPFRLVAEALGYQSVARRVEVRAGEVTDVQLVMQPIVLLDEPYTHTYDRVALIHFANALAAVAILTVNNSAVNGLMCEGCHTVNHVPTGAKGGMTEVLFVSGTSNTVLNPDVFIYVKRNWTTGAYGDGTTILSGYFKNRQAGHWPESKALAQVDKIMLVIEGAGLGVSFEHKVQVFNSLSYNAPLADDFTALPPP